MSRSRGLISTDTPAARAVILIMTGSDFDRHMSGRQTGKFTAIAHLPTHDEHLPALQAARCHVLFVCLADRVRERVPRRAVLFGGIAVRRRSGIAPSIARFLGRVSRGATADHAANICKWLRLRPAVFA
jgi:hypothetical protein